MGGYLEIPEGLVEGYATHSKRAPATPEKQTVIRSDNGPRPSLPTAKRLKMGSSVKLPPQKSLQSSPLHKGRCCNWCTKASMCQRRCKCRKAGRHCFNCDCIDRCRNKLDYKAALCGVIADNQPDSDVSPTPGDVSSITQGESSKTHDEDSESPVAPTRLLAAADESRGSHTPDNSPILSGNGIVSAERQINNVSIVAILTTLLQQAGLQISPVWCHRDNPPGTWTVSAPHKMQVKHKTSNQTGAL